MLTPIGQNFAKTAAGPNLWSKGCVVSVSSVRFRKSEILPKDSQAMSPNWQPHKASACECLRCLLKQDTCVALHRSAQVYLPQGLTSFVVVGEAHQDTTCVQRELSGGRCCFACGIGRTWRARTLRARQSMCRPKSTGRMDFPCRSVLRSARQSHCRWGRPCSATFRCCVLMGRWSPEM